jgi:hypothetical protein
MKVPDSSRPRGRSKPVHCGAACICWNWLDKRCRVTSFGCFNLQTMCWVGIIVEQAMLRRASHNFIVDCACVLDHVFINCAGSSLAPNIQLTVVIVALLFTKT